MTPPSCRRLRGKHPKTLINHGDSRVDDYFWLRDKADPKVMEYLHAEDAYADAVMEPVAALQDSLYREMVGHIKETDDSAPYLRDGCFYYSRTITGQQYPILCRKRGNLTASEEILLDLNELAKGQKFMALGAYEVSDDGNLLAYTTDNTGYRQFTLQVKDLQTGDLLPDRVERVNNVAWATDNKTIFYVIEDPVTKRSDKFFRHTVGGESGVLLYDELDELYDITVRRTLDRAFIILQSTAKTSTEVRYMPAGESAAALQIVAPREADHEYDLDHRGDLFYIRTNKGAKNFRIVTVPVSDPSEKNWKEIVAHGRR
jgi:oligopeptidase B